MLTGGTNEMTTDYSLIACGLKCPPFIKNTLSILPRRPTKLTLHIISLPTKMDQSEENALPQFFAWHTKSDFMSFNDEGDNFTTCCNFVNFTHSIVKISSSSSIGSKSEIDLWLYLQERTVESYTRTYRVTEDNTKSLLLRKNFGNVSRALKRTLGRKELPKKCISALQNEGEAVSTRLETSTDKCS